MSRRHKCDIFRELDENAAIENVGKSKSNGENGGLEMWRKRLNDRRARLRDRWKAKTAVNLPIVL